MSTITPVASVRYASAGRALLRVTGVKSFIVSHDGIVYEKDLGEKSVELFRAMERYDPDSTWKPVQDD